MPWYQPETAFQIFNRVMFDKDVATGEVAISDEYASSGPASVEGITNEVSPSHERYCYLWDMLETCLLDEYAIVMSGSAIIKDYVLLGYTAPNGTNIYLLNGTTLGEQLMASDSSNGTVPEGSSPTGSPAEQIANAASPVGLKEGTLLSLLLAVLVVVAC